MAFLGSHLIAFLSPEKCVGMTVKGMMKGSSYAIAPKGRFKVVSTLTGREVK